MAEDWQKWQKQFRALEEYRRLHPNHWPGPNTRFPGRNALGAWCARQQREYKRNNLSRPRLKKLLDLGFPLLTEKSRWERRRAIYTYNERGWLLRFEDLRAYRRRHPGKWPKTTDTVYRNRSLAAWLSKNRRRSLRPEFKRLLKAMGFDFIPQNQELERRWSMQFRNLQKFRKKNPHRWPEQKDEYPVGNRLGQWMNNQRQNKKKGILQPDRERKLLAIGFDFNPGWLMMDTLWEKHFCDLLEFRKRNPDRWPTTSEEYPTGNKLGKWISHQRSGKKTGRLPPEREKKLRSIGFDFSSKMRALAAQWNKQFKYLLAFRKESPHRWPLQKEKFPGGNKLGGWVNRQRYLESKNRMPPDRRKLLESIGFPLGDMREEQWEKQFKVLRTFRKENPHGWPGQKEEYPDGNKLGVWVTTQRQRKKKGTLGPYEESKLRALGFDFNPGDQEVLDTRWDRQFKHLQAFRRENPHRWPTAKEEYPKGNKLGIWLHNQKSPARCVSDMSGFYANLTYQF